MVVICGWSYYGPVVKRNCTKSCYLPNDMCWKLKKSLQFNLMLCSIAGKWEDRFRWCNINIQDNTVLLSSVMNLFTSLKLFNIEILLTLIYVFKAWIKTYLSWTAWNQLRMKKLALIKNIYGRVRERPLIVFWGKK